MLLRFVDGQIGIIALIKRVLLMCAMVVSGLSIEVVAAPTADKWAFWDQSDPSSTAIIDHSLWQQVLDSYLNVGDDGINRFAYKGVDSSGKQQLSAYLRQMAQIDSRAYNASEQQAYWINVYNALTVNVVLKYPKKKSILRMGEQIFSVGPWDDTVYEVAGQELTLNDIEHRILRPIFKDHRVHYAVNCASIGCPNLGAKAFAGAELEAQLARQEREYISHPRGVTFDKKGRLKLSQIYEWYGSDFAADEARLITHLAVRHETLGAKLAVYSGKVSYHYDWDLNTAD
jgi:hypothetical protein